MTRRPQKSTLFPYPTLFRALLLLAGLGLFVELDWGRFPLWLAAVAAGALAFAALGLAIGALTREVRSASLLAFMLALPLRSEEHTSELPSRQYLVWRLLLDKKHVHVPVLPC